MIPRRSLLLSLLAAPVIVRADSLMPISTRAVEDAPVLDIQWVPPLDWPDMASCERRVFINGVEAVWRPHEPMPAWMDPHHG